MRCCRSRKVTAEKHWITASILSVYEADVTLSRPSVNWAATAEWRKLYRRQSYWQTKKRRPVWSCQFYRDHSFSTHSKFSEKLTFLNPWKDRDPVEILKAKIRQRKLFSHFVFTWKKFNSQISDCDIHSITC